MSSESSASPVLPALARKRLIFTITTGRSGTAYLCRVLGLFRAVHSRHEPKPTFSRSLRVIRAGPPEVAREWWLRQKLPAIARSGAAIYAETSHVAAKGYLESLLSLGLVPDLIHLRRDPRAVALSLLALGTVPGRTFKGVKYYLSPRDDPFLPPRGVAEARFSDYQLCYWYCLEMAERARVYAERFAPQGLRVFPVDLEEIRTDEGIERLGESLDLGPLSAWGRVRKAGLGRRKVNAMASRKRPVDLPPKQLDTWEAEVQGWVS